MVGVLVPKPLGFEHDLNYSHFIQSVSKLLSQVNITDGELYNSPLAIKRRSMKIPPCRTKINQLPLPDGPDGHQIIDPRGGADQRKLHILVTWSERELEVLTQSFLGGHHYLKGGLKFRFCEWWFGRFGDIGSWCFMLQWTNGNYRYACWAYRQWMSWVISITTLQTLHHTNKAQATEEYHTDR